jgi:hypothetical protein
MWAGIPSSVFFDKSSGFAGSFSVPLSAQLFTTQDMMQTVSGCFQPTFNK